MEKADEWEKTWERLILPHLEDQHPRVRYAAIYAIGQLGTDLEGELQERFGVRVLQGLVKVSGSSESR